MSCIYLYRIIIEGEPVLNANSRVVEVQVLHVAVTTVASGFVEDFGPQWVIAVTLGRAIARATAAKARLAAVSEVGKPGGYPGTS